MSVCVQMKEDRTSSTIDWVFSLPEDEVDKGFAESVTIEIKEHSPKIDEVSLKKLKGIQCNELVIRVETFNPTVIVQILQVLDLSELEEITLPEYSDYQRDEENLWDVLIDFVVMKARKLKVINGHFTLNKALCLAAKGYEISGECRILAYSEDLLRMMLESIDKVKINVAVIGNRDYRKDSEKLLDIKSNLKIQKRGNNIYIKS